MRIDNDLKEISSLDNADETNLKRLSELVGNLPEKEKKEALIIAKKLTISHSFSGPLPHPSIIEGYNKNVENAGERVFIMAEKEQAHRISIENYAIKKELQQKNRGQVFAFTLGMTGLLTATGLAIYGHDAIAGVFATTTIGGLATAFVIGVKNQNKDN